MRAWEWILIIVNAMFGFVQIFIALLYLEFWMGLGLLLLSMIFFAFGYIMIIESRFKKINAHLLWGVILLAGNLAFLSTLGFDIVRNSGDYAIQLDLIGFEIITYLDFEELGNLIARSRGVS